MGFYLEILRSPAAHSAVTCRHYIMLESRKEVKATWNQKPLVTKTVKHRKKNTDAQLEVL